jgi:hypothetical protein
MKYAGEMASCGVIYMKIDIGVQVILKFFLRNFRGGNDDITNGRD